VIIRRLLIANRGEIAVRLLRTCRQLGIETILAASDADLDSTPARLADRVVRLGPAAPQASYLSVDSVMAAAQAAGVDAVHPGYGFLAESPVLATACAERGLIFVGPTPGQLRAVGDKLQARAEALEAGLPLLPGGEVTTLAEAERLLAEIGPPLLVKAVGGGGGRGTKQLTDPRALAQVLELSIAEARAAFGEPRVYLERYLDGARHIEVQLLGDGEEVIHLGDRDCSVQRRYQKLLEEAPAPDLPSRLRGDLHAAAVRLARHLAYRSLGTVEFLVDTRHEAFFFLEVNPRIQVEHPVTEAVSGLDLVAEQLAVAEGRPLRLRQEDVTLAGHAIECRLNAEDPERDFQPGPGTVRHAVFPAGEGIRVDTALQAGTVVPPYYDSLVAKLIAVGTDRDAALGRMSEALRRCRIDGVPTTVSLHQAVVADAEFAAGGVDTGWLARWLASREHTGTRAGEVSHG
jgi:acetyl-CoA carboxylase, biotin carboxylase subunit